MKLIINIKPFSFGLTRKLITSKGIIHKKIGLLLQLKDSYGNCGWGEVSPIEGNELKEARIKKKYLPKIKTKVPEDYQKYDFNEEELNSLIKLDTNN